MMLFTNSSILTFKGNIVTINNKRQFEGIKYVCTTNEHAYLFTGSVALVFQGEDCVKSVAVEPATKYAVSEQGKIASLNPYLCLDGKRVGGAYEYVAFKPDGSEFVAASQSGYTIYSGDGYKCYFRSCDYITSVVWGDKLYIGTRTGIKCHAEDPARTIANRSLIGVTNEGYIVTSIGDIIDPDTGNFVLFSRYVPVELYFKNNRFATSARVYSFTEWVCLQLDIRLPKIDGPALIIADYLEEYGHRGYEELREFMRIYDRHSPSV